MARKAAGAEKPADREYEAPAQGKLDTYGLEAVCNDIADRKSLTAIAEHVGVSIGTLLTWVDKDAERSARVREARRAVARLWDEQAETEIRGAGDDFELRRAKELAHHYRWRASKISPEYGDAVTLKGDKDNPLQIAKAVDLSDADLLALAAGDKAMDG